MLKVEIENDGSLHFHYKPQEARSESTQVNQLAADFLDLTAKYVISKGNKAPEKSHQNPTTSKAALRGDERSSTRPPAFSDSHLQLCLTDGPQNPSDAIKDDAPTNVNAPTKNDAPINDDAPINGDAALINNVLRKDDLSSHYSSDSCSRKSPPTRWEKAAPSTTTKNVRKKASRKLYIPKKFRSIRLDERRTQRTTYGETKYETKNCGQRSVYLHAEVASDGPIW